MLRLLCGTITRVELENFTAVSFKLVDYFYTACIGNLALVAVSD